MNDGGRHACACGGESEIVGTQLGEVMEQRRQVGTTEWISAADQERARTARDGARGAEDVARRELLIRRRTASPRQPGGTANQRDSQIDASDCDCRDGGPPACTTRRRRV
jgi:hypothetical protein